MRRVDPFLLNFITLGLILSFLILTIYSIVQHVEISDKVAKQELATAKIDNARLYEILREIAVSQNLTKDVLQDHFNQTETIINSITESGNATRLQAEEIGNRTR